jgi:beta-glucosidase
MKKIYTVLGLIVLSPLFALAQPAPQLREDNIDEVLKAMTLEEKAMLLVGNASHFTSSTAVVGGSAVKVPGAAGTTAAIPRLGIPETVLTDGPAGVRINATREGTSQTFYATGFPIGSCLASTWNTGLVRMVGEAIGEETRDYHCDVILGPGMNLHRNPLCGRNFEYYSEDPLLTGKIAASYVLGVQSKGVGVSIKHFAVNSQETNRTGVDERVSQRALRELYLRGFEYAVREAKPWTVMSAYNRINGTYAQGNRDLLTSVLRDDWGFRGIVMTDWIGERADMAMPDQVRAGNDLFEPGEAKQMNDIIDAVKSGKLDIKDVDCNVRNMLEYIVKTPTFRKYQATDKPDLKAHAAITRATAAEGIVLLKNDNATLPMKDVKKVALFGVGSYHFLSGGVGSGCVHTPYIVDMVEGLKNAGIASTPNLTEMYTKYVDFQKIKTEADRDPARWFERPDMGDQKLPEIVISRQQIQAEASASDAAIITLSRQAGEGIDRAIEGEFNLTQLEQEMIGNVTAAYHQMGKKVIVIINSGSVIETASWRNLPDAILMAWQPGEEGGNSVADIMTGKVCPSGKLTMTWPIQAADHPSTANFPQDDMTIYHYESMKGWSKEGLPNRNFTNHEEDIWVGYRYFDTFGRNVAYPFGYGLSYTTFAYGQPRVKQSGDKITVTVPVRNTGKVAGKEVVQVYVSAPKGNMVKPAKELKAFGKTRELKAGESETLTLTMDVRDLASFDEAGSQWVADAGTYRFMVGANVSDIRGTATASLKRYVEKVSNVLAPTHAINKMIK